ncbi:MAG: type II/IV secretion system protein, partial [Deltaproteobacteria bacterium]|nr:type II/IV secretion system protein [Deltaproteobacteria bacterium]
FAKEHRVIPIYQMGDIVTIATADPTNQYIIKKVEKLMGSPVSPVFALPKAIEDAIEIQHQTTSALSGFIAKIAEDASLKGTTQITSEQLKELAEDQSVVEFCRGVIILALRERASDIHIEPGEDMVRIRFRIDGVLQEKMKIEKILLPAITSRLKIVANLDIVEKRKPQDGRATFQLPNKSIDIRFSTVPTIYGEKLVLRILGQAANSETLGLEELYLSKSSYDEVRKVIDSPNGVFFVTGPTGSGKTTTLFAILKHLNTPAVNIMTIEDPVEVRLPGINQVQVNADIGVDFGSALRAFLRQDPNVILIGEIRDVETAKIASQAALTGHLVLATMHTNNALQAVTRLVEIGVEPFLVAPSIIGVMAQRLVRRICEYCKEKYKLPVSTMERYFLGDPNQEIFVCRGRGCIECNQSGYVGRVGVHEIFIMSEQVRSMVAKGASILEIEAEAFRSGYKTMRYDGMKKVLRGITTIEEIESVSTAEEKSY